MSNAWCYITKIGNREFINISGKYIFPVEAIKCIDPKHRGGGTMIATNEDVFDILLKDDDEIEFLSFILRNKI